MKCSVCKCVGHNKRMCPLSANVSKETASGLQCSACGVCGHNKLPLVLTAPQQRSPRVWMIPGWVSDGNDSRRDQFLHSIRRGTPFLNIGSLSRNGDAYGRKFLDEVSYGDIILLQNTGGYMDGRGKKISSGLCGIFVVSGEILRGVVEYEGFYDKRFVRDRAEGWEYERMIPLKVYRGTTLRNEDPVGWASLPVSCARTPVEKDISVLDIERISSHFR